MGAPSPMFDFHPGWYGTSTTTSTATRSCTPRRSRSTRSASPPRGRGRHAYKLGIKLDAVAQHDVAARQLGVHAVHDAGIDKRELEVKARRRVGDGRAVARLHAELDRALEEIVLVDAVLRRHFDFHRDPLEGLEPRVAERVRGERAALVAARHLPALEDRARARHCDGVLAPLKLPGAGGTQNRVRVVVRFGHEPRQRDLARVDAQHIRSARVLHEHTQRHGAADAAAIRRMLY